MTDFQTWRATFAAKAAARGVPAGPLEQATYRADVIAKDRHQPEQSLSLPDYLARVVTHELVENGRDALVRYAVTFGRIETRYRVDRNIIAAIWGVETRYGTVRGDVPVLSALATLAFDGRRKAFFEAELIHALQIIAEGHAPPDMVGSWAGAMGHTQFMPSSHRHFAVDFDGDGRANIWGDNPTDALASTASYLARHSWQHGIPTITPARPSPSADLSQARPLRALYPSAWTALGVSSTAPTTPHELWLPAGAEGPAFLTSVNFRALKAYNTSNAYALAVATLAERLAGTAPNGTAWPQGAPLTRAETRALQSYLTAAGCDTHGTDGLNGPNTTRAIRLYQREQGLVVDGHPSRSLLGRLVANSSTN